MKLSRRAFNWIFSLRRRKDRPIFFRKKKKITTIELLKKEIFQNFHTYRLSMFKFKIEKNFPRGKQ